MRLRITGYTGPRKIPLVVDADSQGICGRKSCPNNHEMVCCADTQRKPPYKCREVML